MTLTRVVAKLRLKRALALWQQRRDEEAIKVGLSAAKHLDSAKVVVAQWHLVKGTWSAAIPLLESAAARGLWEAKQVLASCYMHGEGVSKDPERAYEIASDAAESGRLDCQILLANYYSTGEDREPNFFLARKYAKMAVENGRLDVLAAVERRQVERSNLSS